MITQGQITIVDLNDITTGLTAPLNPVVNQLWYDTSVSPNVLKKYNGTTWDVSGTQVFVSQPTTAQSYAVGDLWVNATVVGIWTNELLKCITAKAAGVAFSTSHWALATKYTDDTAVNNLQIGGRNYFLNSDFKKYSTSDNIGWDNSLNGHVILEEYASGYNPGVPNPTVGYHGHADITTFAFPVFAFIDRNTQFGQAHRWMALIYTIGSTNSAYSILIPNNKITISMDIYTDTIGTVLEIGLYHYLVGTSTQNFFALDTYSTPSTSSDVGKWVRRSVTFVLESNFDTSKTTILYIYGMDNAVECSQYVKNLKIENGNKATDWTPSPEDVDASISAAHDAAVATAAIAAQAAADLAEINAKAHADGIVTIEEQRAIDDATAKANAAQQAAIAAAAADATAKANAAQQAAIEAATNLASTITISVAEVQRQLDGVIIAWYSTVDPTMSNYPVVDATTPANSWSTDDIKNQHANDTFTNTSTGGCWRFQWDVTNGWHWGVIADTATQQALIAANNAQTTANSKRQVFVSQPTDAQSYAIGDLWVNATVVGIWTNELLKCITAKAAGVAFSASHWALATKYTDDTAVNNLQIGGENRIVNSNFTLVSDTQNYKYSVLVGSDSVTALAASVYLKKGTTHVFTVEQIAKLAGTATAVSLNLYDFVANISSANLNTTLNFSTSKQTKTFTVPATGNWCLLIYSGIAGSTADNTVQFTNLMCQEGNRETTYKPAIAYLTEAMQSTTEVNGGLLSTVLLRVKDAGGAITGGMSGLVTDNVGFWTGGTYDDAIAGTAKSIDWKNGSFQRAGGKIKGTAAGALSIGNLTIDNGDIVGLDSSSVERIRISTGVIPDINAILFAAWLVCGTGGFDSAEVGDLTTDTTSQLITPQTIYLYAASASFSITSVSDIKLTNPSATVTVYPSSGSSLINSQTTAFSITDGTNVYYPTAGVISSVPVGTYTAHFSYTVVFSGSAVKVTTYSAMVHVGFESVSAYSIPLRTMIGSDGFYSLFGSSFAPQLFHFKSGLGLQARGAIDIPAGLGGGSFTTGGGLLNSWGGKPPTGCGGTTTKTITHNIGDTNYTIMVTMTSNNSYYVTGKTETQIQVVTSGSADFIFMRTK